MPEQASVDKKVRQMPKHVSVDYERESNHEVRMVSNDKVNWHKRTVLWREGEGRCVVVAPYSASRFKCDKDFETFYLPYNKPVPKKCYKTRDEILEMAITIPNMVVRIKGGQWNHPGGFSFDTYIADYEWTILRNGQYEEPRKFEKLA